MPVLTYEQLTFLNSYSIVTEEPKNPLFTLENIHKEFFLKDFLKLMMEITQASTEVKLYPISAVAMDYSLLPNFIFSLLMMKFGTEN